MHTYAASAVVRVGALREVLRVPVGILGAVRYSGAAGNVFAIYGVSASQERTKIATVTSVAGASVLLSYLPSVSEGWTFVAVDAISVEHTCTISATSLSGES